jgi:hypothetical protein
MKGGLSVGKGVCDEVRFPESLSIVGGGAIRRMTISLK